MNDGSHFVIAEATLRLIFALAGMAAEGLSAMLVLTGKNNRSNRVMITAI